MVNARPVPLVRNRDFLLLWSGQTISSLGSSMSGIAFPLLVLAITHSPSVAGIIGALAWLPYVLFGLPAGALVDRWNRKRAMIVCDTGRALLLGSIAIALALGRLTFVQLVVVVFGEGTLYVFFNLANNAAITRVVPKSQLAAATARDQFSAGSTVLTGPALGTALFAIARLLPFAADAISYAFSAISLWFIRTPFQEDRSAPQKQLWHEIREGMHWLWEHPILRRMAGVVSSAALLQSGQILIVIVAAQRQHLPSALIGVIFTIGGIGSLLGSFVSGSINRRFAFGRIIGVSIGAWAIGYAGYALGAIVAFPTLFHLPSVLLVLGGTTAIISIALSIFNVASFSYRVSLIPDELQGRVNSVFRLIGWGTIPVGQVIVGALLQNIGPAPTAILIALGLAVLTLVVMVTPALQRAKSLADGHAHESSQRSEE